MFLVKKENSNPEHIYSFSKEIERRGTSSVKHDMMERDFGRNDLMPMWVADMDFPTPEFILEAIRERCNDSVLGYTYGNRDYYSAVIWWLKRHYKINADKKELHYIPGIVAGIAFVIQSFTNEGDKILINTPVYPPFVNLPTNNNRILVKSPLYIENQRFYIDFDDFREKIKGCKLFIMSNPHNPGGIVWTKEELAQIADICHENNCLVISDEIHADLILNNKKENISFSTVSEKAKEISITFIAPSKSFNIPGLSSSIAYIPNETIRKKYFDYIDGYELANGNVFAYLGATVAYTPDGELWLKQLNVAIKKNVMYATKYLKRAMPKVKCIIPEASYLIWLDFSDYGLSHDEVKDILINKAKVALNDGTDFGGKEYSCCFRINVGCPKLVVRTALIKISTAFKNITDKTIDIE